MSVNFPRRGREFVHFMFRDPIPAGLTVQVSVDGGTSWAALDSLSRILLRGPEFAGDSQGVLVKADVEILYRVLDNPEDMWRSAGMLYLVDVIRPAVSYGDDI